MPEEVQIAELSLRERNKQDKLLRIKSAARALFNENGFDDATIREIAKQAEVGVGTLFQYAANKRDLLFLIYNDELDAFPFPTCDEVDDSLPAIEQFLSFFEKLYRFFAAQPDLARDLLRESIFYDSGIQAERFWQSRQRAEDELEKLIRRGQDAGLFDTAVDPATATVMLFAIYRSEVRRWLQESEDAVDADTGIAMLRPILALSLSGLTSK
ncbi:MAG: TetR/AcrR family transcriptional regulator [Proteobacteria bacterium]|nr:TetR/AcrR family transcriptional regulator [Pseudomonadota bacterium]